MKNIAVALDLTSNSGKLLEQAEMMARIYNAKVWLIHVVDPDPDFVGYSVGPNYIREDRADMIKAEHKMLDGYKQELIAKAIDVEALLIQGPIAVTLLEEIEKLDIDLIIVGKKGHGVLYRAFIGSTLSAIIQKVNIPLLAVPFLEKE